MGEIYLTIRYLLINVMKTPEGWRKDKREQRRGGNLQEQVSSTSEWDTVRKKGKRKGNRKTAKWRLGGQHKHWYHKGEVFLCVMDKNISEAKKVKADHHSPSKISYRCWFRGCRDVWLRMIPTILFMGNLTWCLHEHEWWGFNKHLNNITTVMRSDVLWESKV